MSKEKTITEKWEAKCKKNLVGKKIINVRYLNEKEMQHCFGRSGFEVPLVIEFDDRSWIFPMRDDEGNDGGAFSTSFEDLQTIPVMMRGEAENE
jgi:hypothetical protein